MRYVLAVAMILLAGCKHKVDSAKTTEPYMKVVLPPNSIDGDPILNKTVALYAIGELQEQIIKEYQEAIVEVAPDCSKVEFRRLCEHIAEADKLAEQEKSIKNQAWPEGGTK